MTLSVLYRGALTSCNFACGYCPFAKQKESRAALKRDQNALVRFTDWIREQGGWQWKILFTPWGEALVRKWYRDAVTELTHLSNVDSVVVQTNLSCKLDWIEACERRRLSLWATYHPTETLLDTFIAKVRQLREWDVLLSVGEVGVPPLLDEIEALRKHLPTEVYLWINAQQPRSRPYTEDEEKRFIEIDPHFPLTLKRTRSFGHSCRTGEQVFTVDAKGDMRRCHFVKEIIGNIYDDNWSAALRPRVCPNRFCDCFLGKAQLNAADLSDTFGDRILRANCNHGEPLEPDKSVVVDDRGRRESVQVAFVDWTSLSVPN